jgi:preprotein translocase subunit SecD
MTILLTTLPLAASEVTENVVHNFIQAVLTGKTDQAEAMLSIDAEAELRLNLINKEQSSNQAAFKKLKIEKSLDWQNEHWVICSLKGDKEFLLFILTPHPKKPMVKQLLPLENLHISSYQIDIENSQKSNHVLETIKQRIEKYGFLRSSIETIDGKLILHMIGNKDTVLLKNLLQSRGEFCLCPILKRSRQKLEYYPIQGMSKRAAEPVSRRSIIDNQHISSLTMSRNTLGFIDLKIQVDAEGRRKLIQQYRNSRKNNRPLVAVLDQKIITRVEQRTSMMAGILLIEGIPSSQDARLISAILQSTPLSTTITLKEFVVRGE